MSLRCAVEKVGDCHYVLPKLGAMRVDAQAFLSERLFEQSEHEVWSQLKAAASYEGVIGAYLMPDAHSGYGVPVGSVVVTENTVIQAASGYDISCGVLYMKVPGLFAAHVADRKLREKWVREVERRIATGLGCARPKLASQIKPAFVDDVLRHGAQALGVDADLCERQFIGVPEALEVTKIESAYSKAAAQLGSVGGGNHFIEMQVDRDTGDVWVMVHCGSRGYGWQTANHFFYEGAKARKLPKNRREESFLYLDEPLGRQYWAHHNSAANYAIANRHLIVRGVQQALEEAYGATAEVYYEISHNLVQEETLVLPDGTTQKGFVHRKGSTRALPSGHPDLLGTRWVETGHPCLIPGSMYAGAAILFPLEGAYRSGCSVNHGSGRLLARGRAKRELATKQKQIDREMREVTRTLGGVDIVGIVGNTPKTPLDECAHVYKELDEVLRVLEAEGVAKIVNRLYPVANIKGVG